jgi:hypothetical protein
MKITAEQLANLDWDAVSEAADRIRQAAFDSGFIAPEADVQRLLLIQKVADQLTTIAQALHIVTAMAK